MGGEGRGAVVPLQTGPFLALSSLGPLRGQEDVATTPSIRDDATTSVRADPTLPMPPVLRPRTAAADPPFARRYRCLHRRPRRPHATHAGGLLPHIVLTPGSGFWPSSPRRYRSCEFPPFIFLGFSALSSNRPTDCLNPFEQGSAQIF
ncbi:Os08g0363200 [Oryza sativa Japonica Group]|uniref:Os08g0363200 protein n=2 Tax=Oryza sativa subsp. japonica TaxID=39947 RepID=B7E9E7_ORYSJ|nr:hypothetical protein OsJ_27060 [Oryza sativa Japonica Group]BAG88994.1 unnamed protein product [Oryza sativa Japonica Group]BAH00799.1 unnamed protein product [Oryza sativa Japonica Group]BAT05123.1 Os08g0363200 [Oryza sativa Japonica Group]